MHTAKITKAQSYPKTTARSSFAKLAQRIYSLSQLTPRAARLTYGVNYCAAISMLGAGSDVWFTDQVSLIRDLDGQLVGFKVTDDNGSELVVDYSDPETLLTVGYPVLAAPSAYIHGAVVPKAVEEQLVRGLCKPNRRWHEAVAEARLKDRKLRRAACARLGTAIVSTCLANVAGVELSPHLSVLRVLPPLLRGPLVWLLDREEDNMAAQQLLVGCPAFALFPAELRARASVGQKALLAELGLPASARELSAAAVGAIAASLRYIGEPSSAAMTWFPWLTASVVSALPRSSFLQRSIVEVGARLGLAGVDVAPVAGWLSKVLPYHKNKWGLNGRERDQLVEWLRAPGRVLKDMDLKTWSSSITLADALEAAEAYGRLASGMTVKAGRAKFKTLKWMPEDALVERCTFERLMSPAELVSEGKRMDNCVGGYAADCASGRCAIYRVSRPVGMPGDEKRPQVNGAVIAATVEVVSVAGRARAVQVRGPGNAAPSSAVLRVLTAVGVMGGV
jgi:hypothetical protein